MDLDWNTELLDQLQWHWTQQLRPRLDGLADDEYLWEPVPGCWSIRPRDQATSPMAVGAGDMVIDFAYPEPSPPPVTTIAWRLGHITATLEMRWSNHFGDGSVTYETTTWPASAAEALAALDAAHARWTGALEGLSTEDLAVAVGPAEGPFAERPWATLILHINREVIHHGAEVALLRDLWRAGLR